MGHKAFVEKWAKDACAQISDNQGTIGFVPLVPLVDPDLTLYDDVNDIFLSGAEFSQGAKKKLNLENGSQSLTDQSPIVATQNQEEDGFVEDNNEESAGPNLDMSRAHHSALSEELIDMGQKENEGNRQLNFSTIHGPMVTFFSCY